MTLKRVTEDEEGADNCEAKGVDECCHSMVDFRCGGECICTLHRVQSTATPPKFGGSVDGYGDEVTIVRQDSVSVNEEVGQVSLRHPFKDVKHLHGLQIPLRVN